MLRIRIVCFLIALGCALSVAHAASAAEVDSDSAYCFTQADFPGGGLAGICITGLPDQALGTVMLGDRVLRPGDILAAGQVWQMTFQPVRSREDATATVTYLPIFEDRVAPAAAVTIAIRGKEDKAPAARDLALETYKNLPLEGALKAADPEAQPLTYQLTRQPRRGNVELRPDGTFTYTPRKNKVGVDSFVFTATDPAGNVSRQATVTVNILKPSDATQYTDTLGRDCRFAAEWMKNTGIFVGEQVADNACFGPDKTVSRGEFLTMLVRALEIPTQEALDHAGIDREVPAWLRPYLAAAIRAGLPAGVPRLQPMDYSAPITGAEAAVMLQNALDLTATEGAAAQGELPVWAADAVTVLQSHGFDLTPEQPLTRAQAAMALYHASTLTDAPGLQPLAGK